MPTVTIQIKNLKQIQHAFGLAPRLMRQNFNKAIGLSLIKIERDSKLRTPVDTGRLRASHRTVLRDLYGEVGTHTEYDTFVHEGTRRMRARPYLRNAVETNETFVTQTFAKAAQDVLDDIGRRT